MRTKYKRYKICEEALVKKANNMPGIYEIKNVVDNKFYIGSSVKVRGRIREHFRELGANTHPNFRLQRAFNKDGKESFVFRQIEKVQEVKDLLKREQHWLDKTHACKNGYNICPNAENTLGCKWTKEQREKHKRLTCGKNNGMYGRTHTEEVRERLSKFRKNYKYPKEFCVTMSAVTKGEKNGMYGKNHCDKTKKIISNKLKARGGHFGKKNPNYGNKWTKKQKESLSQNIKIRGGFNGEKNPNYGNTKIPKSEWREIVQTVLEKRTTVAKLAKEKGCSIQTIYKIIKFVKTNNEN